jgi:hypothetical protein
VELTVHRFAGGIIYGHNLLAFGFGDLAMDSAAEDIIVQPELDVIYTTSNKGLYRARAEVFRRTIGQGPAQVRRRRRDNISNFSVATVKRLKKTYCVLPTYCYTCTES